MNNTNLVPLDIDGRRLYALDQTELRFLRTMADLTGLTIAEFIDQAAEFFLAQQAACDAKKEHYQISDASNRTARATISRQRDRNARARGRFQRTVA
jgi:hypothetical protein